MIRRVRRDYSWDLYTGGKLAGMITRYTTDRWSTTIFDGDGVHRHVFSTPRAAWWYARASLEG